MCRGSFRRTHGGGAAPCAVYRHALLRIISELLGPLDAGRARAGRGGRWSPAAVAFAGVLMGWDPAPTLAQRFESVLGVLDAALPRRRRTGRTYQGFVKALDRHADDLLHTLAPRLRIRTRQAAGARWRLGRFVPIGVDGSRFDAPRTIANEPLGFSGKSRCSPQMMGVLLIHLGTMIPWDFGVGGARESERAILRRMIERLPDDALLIADAGYTGFELLSHLHASGIPFLIRVGRGVRLLRGLGEYRREGEGIVHLWPENARHRPPLRLRLIRIGGVWLITDVTDPHLLSKKAAAELYRRRWGLEVAFRSLKQTLDRGKVRSCAASNAVRELVWSMLALWTLNLIGARAIRSGGHEPERLSIAATLAAVRHGRDLPSRLRSAIRDHYTRRASKDAYRRARKEHQTPPGPPILLTASNTQIAQATRVRQQIDSA
ncbi:MAG: transposase [Phycisphaerales bacterium]